MSLPSQGTSGPDHSAPASPSFFARARKLIVAVLGFAATVIASGVLDDPQYDTIRTWVQVAIGVATAAGVYRVPNAGTGQPKGLVSRY